MAGLPVVEVALVAKMLFLKLIFDQSCDQGPTITKEEYFNNI